MIGVLILIFILACALIHVTGGREHNYYIAMDPHDFTMSMEVVLAHPKIRDYIKEMNPKARQYIMDYKNISLVDKLQDPLLVSMISKIYKESYDVQRSYSVHVTTPTLDMPPGMRRFKYFDDPRGLERWARETFAFKMKTAYHVNHGLSENAIMVERYGKELSKGTTYVQTARMVPKTYGPFNEFIDFVKQDNECDEDDIRVAFTMQTSREGIKMHFDDIMGSAGPIITINLGASTAYDMFPVFTNLYYRPIRVPLAPGDVVVLDNEAKVEWLHSIPDGMPLAHRRCALLIKVTKRCVPGYYYYPERQETATLPWFGGKYIKLYHPRLFQYYNEKYYTEEWIITQCMKLDELAMKGQAFTAMNAYMRCIVHTSKCDAEWWSNPYTRVLDNWSTTNTAYGSRIFVNLPKHYQEHLMGLLDDPKVHLIITPILIEHPAWDTMSDRHQFQSYYMFYLDKKINERIYVYRSKQPQI